MRLRPPIGNPLKTLKKRWLDGLYTTVEITPGEAISRWTDGWAAAFQGVDTPLSPAVKYTTLKGGAPALDFDGTYYSALTVPGSSIVSGEAMTWVWVGETYWDGTDREGLFANGTYSPGIIMGSNEPTNGHWGVFLGTHIASTFAVPNKKGTKLTTVIYTRDGTNLAELWVDGELVLTHSNSGSFSGADINFGSTSTGTQYGNSKMGFFGYYKGRYFSQNEIREISADPWGVLYGAEPRTRFALADPLPQTRLLDVPQVWDKQPPAGAEIDLANPLTKDLGYVYDLRNYPYKNSFNYGPELDLENGAAQITHGAIDRLGNQGVQFTSTENYVANGASETHKFLGFKHSILVQFDYNNYSAGNYVFLNYSTTATAWHIGHNSSGNFRYTHSGAADYDLTSTTVSAGVWRIIYTSTGALGTARIYAKNLTTGAYYTDSVSLGTPVSPTQNRLIIGWDGGGSTARGIHSLFAEWGRTLSESEALALIDNPWQIFKADNLHVPIEHEELTFASEGEERLFTIPQKNTRQPR